MNKQVKPKKIKFTRNFALYVLIALFFIGYGVRLFDWQVVNGAKYIQIADQTNTYYVSIDAARGEIFDAKGEKLAINKTGFAIVFDRASMKKGAENSTILQLTELFRSYNQKWIDKLPIELSLEGEWVFKDGQPNSIASLKKWLELQQYATADNCMEALSNIFKLRDDKDPDTKEPIVYTKRQVRDIVGVRYNMNMAGFDISNPYVFAGEVSQQMVSIVSEMGVILPGVDCRTSTIRQYENTDVAPHLIGFIGAVTDEDTKRDEFYNINDKIGKQGVEQALEERLRGKKGVKKIETTPRGELISEKVIEYPVPGESVNLTLDVRFQKKCQEFLQKNIENIVESAIVRGEPNKGQDCNAGSYVVLDVKKGNAVLAAGTYPSYDLELYLSDADYNLALQNDPNDPLVNRALQGKYAPGSTMKPAIAAAALEEGLITDSSTINCKYVYDKYASLDFKPKCQGEHGPINVSTALCRSCNYFFYEIGDRLKIDYMYPYCVGFGLGQPTGIEISENLGTLASNATKIAQRQEGWAAADNVMFAIGQSINLFTPIQLATYASTLATGGIRYRTHIVDNITDYGGREVLLNNDKPEVMPAPNIEEKTPEHDARKFELSEYTTQTIRKGMEEVVLYGTAANDAEYGSSKLKEFSQNKIPVAGKTGTAEVRKGQESDYAFFIAYAPADDPKVAVAVAIEHGTYGRYTGDLVYDILNEYFYGSDEEESSNDENSGEESSGTADVITIPSEPSEPSEPEQPEPENLSNDPLTVNPAIDTARLLGEDRWQALAVRG